MHPHLRLWSQPQNNRILGEAREILKWCGSPAASSASAGLAHAPPNRFTAPAVTPEAP